MINIYWYFYEMQGYWFWLINLKLKLRILIFFKKQTWEINFILFLKFFFLSFSFCFVNWNFHAKVFKKFGKFFCNFDGPLFITKIFNILYYSWPIISYFFKRPSSYFLGRCSFYRRGLPFNSFRIINSYNFNWLFTFYLN